jgi:hypothetical protein
LKRSAHILLALLAGILLQASCLAIGTGAHDQAGVSSKLGFRLIDLGSIGPLLDPDLPDAPQPYLRGPSPKSITAPAIPTAILSVAPAGAGLAPFGRPHVSRPPYLTTLRLRL